MLHWPSRDTPVFGCAHFYPEGEQRPTAYADEGKDAAMARMFERQARRALSAGLIQYLGDISANISAQVLAVKELLDAGLIRHWGLSNENGYGAARTAAEGTRVKSHHPDT